MKSLRLTAMWVKGIIFWVIELGYQVEAAWRPTVIVLQGFMAT
jgi:hypothetical protein